jgi:hypothetical protein
VVLVPRDGGADPAPRRTGRLNAEHGGFSLHAATHVHANDKRAREALCRYILRPSLSNDRLTALPDGQVRITLKKPFRDGTTAVELAPQALMARLAAIIPTPRLHVVRYHGVLAPRSRVRAQIVPGPRADAAETAADRDGKGTPPAPPPAADDTVEPAPATKRRYLPWAELLKRTFRVDVLHCDECGGRMRLVALVKDPTSVHRFLTGVGLPTGPPPPPTSGAGGRDPAPPFAEPFEPDPDPYADPE